MQQNPLVSVVIPVLNGLSAGPGFLQQSLNSLVQQDYQGPLEIILVDDGSRDSTADWAEQQGEELAKTRKSRRLVVIRQPHSGVTAALNTGLRKTTGGYIARQDADDYSTNDRIRKQVEFLRGNPDVGMVASAVKAVNSQGRVDATWYLWRESRVPRTAFVERSPFCHGSVMFCREAVFEAGLYDTQFPHAQDYDLFWRIACRYPVASIPEALYCYRIHPKRVTSNPRRFRIQLDCARRIQRRIAREINV